MKIVQNMFVRQYIRQILFNINYWYILKSILSQESLKKTLDLHHCKDSCCTADQTR